MNALGEYSTLQIGELNKKGKDPNGTSRRRIRSSGLARHERSFGDKLDRRDKQRCVNRQGMTEG